MHAVAQAFSEAPVLRPFQFKAYQHRPARFIELWRPARDWRLKVYGINVDQQRHAPGTMIDDKLLNAAKDVVASVLQREELQSDVVHDAGYMIVHQGVLGNWLLLDWWSHDVLWNQLLFRSESAVAPEFLSVTNGIIACVWEVCIMSFERDAWVRNMLQAGENVPRGKALDAYFETRFNGDI